LFAHSVVRGHEFEYLILVTSRLGTTKVNAFGFLNPSERKDGPR
jgi:hypothetical protein